MKKLRTTIFSSFVLFPSLAFAQTGSIRDLDSFILFLREALDKIIPFLVLVALLVFVISALNYALASSRGGDTKNAKNKMIWGIIGLFVILSIWGIIGVVARTFETGTGGVFQTALHPVKNIAL